MNKRYELTHDNETMSIYIRDAQEGRVLSWDEIEDLLNDRESLCPCQCNHCSLSRGG